MEDQEGAEAPEEDLEEDHAVDSAEDRVADSAEDHAADLAEAITTDPIITEAGIAIMVLAVIITVAEAASAE